MMHQDDSEPKTACKGAPFYQGVYPPECNNGNPCDHCKGVWANEEKIRFDLDVYGVAFRDPETGLYVEWEKNVTYH